MVDAQGRKFLMTPLDSKDDPAVIHLTSEKAEALTYFTGKDNLTTKSINQAIVVQPTCQANHGSSYMLNQEV